MAASGKQQSRWGSFLSQAVAGVESRLDNILAETDEERSATPAGVAGAAAAAAAATKTLSNPQPAASARASSVNSRASSSNRANDRLQARLAKAMAGKNAAATGESRGIAAFPRSSIDNASRGSMERLSIDKDQTDKSEPPPTEPAPEPEPEPSLTPVTTDDVVSTTTTTELIPVDGKGPIPDLKGEPASTEGSPDKATQPKQIEAEPPEDDQEPTTSTDNTNTNNGAELACELEELKARHQEEVREYVEQIDSLQSKLQYLSKTAADAAKKTASSAPSGSMERKLAEKDERVALLMEEGQKLASSEQKYRTTIKKLRLQITGHDRQLEELRKDKDKAVADAEALRKNLDGSEENEKRRQETMKATAALQKEIDSLRKDKASKDETIRRLEQDVKSKLEQAEAAHADALGKALAAERDKQKRLENANTALRADLEASNDKARQDMIEWGEKLERAVERGRSVEAELRVELETMERKLESMRTAAEEATSGSGGEAQVKLFRQIETLQSQYASARENWQGIEASLLAKASGLEKERDEAQRRESEMRKKARDAAGRCRALEDELQDAQPALAASQRELEACRGQLDALRASSRATETALEQTRAELDKEKRTTSRDFTAEAERRQWVDEVAGAASRNQSRPDSPLLSVSRTFSSDMVGLSVPGRPRRVPTPGSIPDSSADGVVLGRRTPSRPPVRSGTMSTTGSIPPPMPFSPFEPLSESPVAPPPSGPERENGVGDTAPSSPRHIAQDMISVSTVAAGPSVQLVERMSAAIRRLEAEKVAAKEEMARVCSQRDEARGDIVCLMKDLEEAKTAASRVPKLEKEVADLDSRYQTTLELLGEKSELVDELRADVEDVKAMYRELVERTVK